MSLIANGGALVLFVLTFGGMFWRILGAKANGEFDFMLKICCRSSDHLEQIHNRIKDYPGVRLTRTHYVLRTVKNIHSSGFEEEPPDSRKQFT